MRVTNRLKVMVVASVAMLVTALTPGVASAADNFDRLVDGNNDSYQPSISDDGNLVVFHTFATNVPGTTTTADRSNVVLYNKSADTYTLVSDNVFDSLNAQISADGSTVVFQSYSNQGVADDNPFSDIFSYDVGTETVTRVTAGLANGEYYSPKVSADGRYIVFSGAPCCTDGVVNGTFDVYYKDTNAGGAPTNVTNGNGDSWFASVSDDGSIVAFNSLAGDLGPLTAAAVTVPAVWVWRPGTGAFSKVADSAARPNMAGGGGHMTYQKASGPQVYVMHKTLNGGAEVNLVPGNGEVLGDAENPFNFGDDRKLRSPGPQISADGSEVVFDTTNPNLAPNDVAGRDVFVWNGSIFLLTTGNSDSFHASISGNGSHITFRSDATNFTTDADTNDFRDIFFIATPTSTPGVNTSFVDVPAGAFYEDAVDWLVAQGITSGTTPTTYSPQNEVTRAQMAAFLWRYAGSPAPAGSHSFSDVPAGAFYEDAVTWLVEQGITGGTTPTTYSPQNAVTRAQMAAFLHRFSGSPTGAPAHSFTDVPAGAFYEDSVSWLVDNGITGGTTPTTYSPTAEVTRAQMAAFLFRHNTNVGL